MAGVPPLRSFFAPRLESPRLESPRLESPRRWAVPDRFSARRYPTLERPVRLPLPPPPPPPPHTHRPQVHDWLSPPVLPARSSFFSLAARSPHKTRSSGVGRYYTDTNTPRVRCAHMPAGARTYFTPRTSQEHRIVHNLVGRDPHHHTARAVGKLEGAGGFVGAVDGRRHRGKHHRACVAPEGVLQQPRERRVPVRNVAPRRLCERRDAVPQCGQALVDGRVLCIKCTATR